MSRERRAPREQRRSILTGVAVASVWAGLVIMTVVTRLAGWIIFTGAVGCIGYILGARTNVRAAVSGRHMTANARYGKPVIPGTVESPIITHASPDVHVMDIVSAYPPEFTSKPNAGTHDPFGPGGEWYEGHPEDLTGPGYTEPPIGGNDND